ncbi:growth-regulating factor 1-like [Cynara cardunculus var. scolymus]|uniref:growth-regulating factor 1-like n=1 Tax=Cynara cardunculus var. scolymus TaxID=59895 RepID=UPI000D62712D|nr:growth-regulating factor 1-like [Cynara cardunculus var. scolymus]
MDFGMTTFDNTPPLLNHDEKTNTINNHGSGFTKQERSEPDPPPDDQQLFLRTSKSSRTDYFDQPINKTMPMRSDSLLSVSAADAGVSNHMLSFSSSSSSSSTNTVKDGNQTSLFSFYQPSPAYIRNTGYGSGGLQAGMQMPVSRYKGPFTPSQWMELEHQALIYKHFVANVPVPSHLLNPLRKFLNTFLFPGSSSSTSYAPNSYGWGTFHLGFSGNTDPEPGRCRRTDGKKWRCSRDAVPDQKYCERHINRGRHRSRKPVEGQNGHAVSGPAAPKVVPVVSSSSVPVSGSRASTTALGGAAIGNQFKTLHHHNATIASSTETTPINRIQESQAFAIPKQNNPVEESSDSLMYPTNYSSFLDQGAPNPNPLPHFVDQWSKVQSGRTSWPEEPKPDWTQLSMSIPMASSDFSSSSNSPTQEKLAVAPLGLSNEFDLDPTHKQASNWIPISWGNSMGGPLGEVLNRTSSSNGVRSKNASSPASEMWDHVNYQLGSSPTGVLQKTTFVSLSNSSSGSSPKGNHGGGGGSGGGGLCDELLLSTLAS